MNRINDGFDEIKGIILRRVAPVLGEVSTKVLLDYLDGYHQSIATEISAHETAINSLKDENTILRGLIGVQDPDVLATILRQGEELRFLRNQLLTATKRVEEHTASEDMLRVALEQAKNECSMARQGREKEQRVFQEEIDKISQNLAAFEDRVKDQAIQFSQEKEKLVAELQAAREQHQEKTPVTIAGEPHVQGTYE